MNSVGLGDVERFEFMYYVVNIHEIVNSLRVDFSAMKLNEKRENEK